MNESITRAQIVVFRDKSEADWTLSTFSINGVTKGCGVEDEHRDKKVHGETRIPNGIYELDLRHSPKFSRSYFVDINGFISPTRSDRFNKEHELIWVKDVPGFEFILWHWGNTDKDTHGCYIVGSNFYTFDGRKGVSGSRSKYVEIYPAIWKMITEAKKAGQKVYVQYRDK